MEELGRIMGLDVGEARTGVALTDPMRILSSPFEVIQVTTPEADIARIQEIIREQEVVEIVAGIPLNKEGGRGPQAEKVAAFVEQLRAVVDIPVEMIDERYSTAAAHRTMKTLKVKGKKKKKVVDQLAAAEILQTYMDRKRNLGG